MIIIESMDAPTSILETKKSLKTLSSGQIYKKNKKTKNPLGWLKKTGFFPTLPPGPWNRFSPPASAARPPAPLLLAASGAGSDPARSPQSADSPPSRNESVEEEI